MSITRRNFDGIYAPCLLRINPLAVIGKKKKKLFRSVISLEKKIVTVCYIGKFPSEVKTKINITLNRRLTVDVYEIAVIRNLKSRAYSMRVMINQTFNFFTCLIFTKPAGLVT